MAKMTTKTLQELSELLGSEELAYKKCCAYVDECSDPTLKTKLGKYANNHKLRYADILWRNSALYHLKITWKRSYR